MVVNSRAETLNCRGTGGGAGVYYNIIYAVRIQLLIIRYYYTRLAIIPTGAQTVPGDGEGATLGEYSYPRFESPRAIESTAMYNIILFKEYNIIIQLFQCILPAAPFNSETLTYFSILSYYMEIYNTWVLPRTGSRYTNTCESQTKFVSYNHNILLLRRSCV